MAKAKKKAAKIETVQPVVVETKVATAPVTVTAPVVTAAQPAVEKPVVVAAPVAAKTAILESANIVAAPVTAPSHEAIARRAYEVYRARNGAPGNAWNDWCQAERELLASIQAKPAARAS